ncbi:Sulfotransferase domain protein [Crateriforma conspicua]|uniref:Sulfotransferase domain protein n=3 Tax=Crateriforma TaxID=2714592 RepID=A0A5C6FSJ8_9PLAN|nr:Sulfotransferase domain protein [Crateriforma conspicua]
MRPGGWLGLLRGGKFRLSPSRWPMAISVSLATPVNTILAGVESAFFAKKVREAEFQSAPVFIIGHWRSGTTLLHELLVRDERFSSPSTFQCFAPSHFLVSEWFFRKFFKWLLPGKRPMDNMAAGWDRPQEDEFALMNLGLPSPYRRIAFPNEPPIDLDYLTFWNVDDAARHQWLETLRRFLLRVSVATQRPLIVKSPTHTGRLAMLARQFPDAKFIHLTRDPRSLFPSTCRLWRSLDEAQALQSPNGDEPAMHEYVLDCFQRMYEAYFDACEQVPSQRLIEMRYEDLVADPVESLRHIYDTLRLADFDSVEEDFCRWAETEHRGYQTNRHRLDAATEKVLLDRWGEYFRRYGYDRPEHESHNVETT